MNKSDLFAYLAAFVTIVLAVALTDMIQSTHRLLRERHRVKWDPLTPLLALAVFLSLHSEFFGLWGDARFDRLTFYGLMGFMAGPTLIALVAFAVLPDDVPESGLDLRRFYFDNRRYIAVLFAVGFVIDMVRTIRWASISNALDDPDFWWLYGPVATADAILTGLMYFSSRWRIQLATLIAMLALGHFAYGDWFIDAASTL